MICCEGWRALLQTFFNANKKEWLYGTVCIYIILVLQQIAKKPVLHGGIAETGLLKLSLGRVRTDIGAKQNANAAFVH